MAGTAVCIGKITSVDEGNFRMSESVTMKKVPVRVKIPLTVEYLAEKIANSKTSGNKVRSWEKTLFEQLAVRCGRGIATAAEADAFYNGVVRLIQQQAMDFHKRNPNWYSVDDLIQLCFTRIWETLDKYKPDDGALSTWVYVISSNVLCKEYHNRKNYSKKFMLCEEKKDSDNEKTGMRGVEKFGSIYEDSLLKMRVRDAIITLFDKHSDKQDILFEFFGNPFIESYEPPVRLPNMAEVQRKLEHYDYTEINVFYNKVVVPFFKNMFPEYHVTGVIH